MPKLKLLESTRLFHAVIHLLMHSSGVFTDNQISSVQLLIHSGHSFIHKSSNTLDVPAIQSAFGSMALYFLQSQTSSCSHESEARNWKELYSILNSLENMAVDPVNSFQPYPQRNTLSTPRQAKLRNPGKYDVIKADTYLKPGSHV